MRSVTKTWIDCDAGVDDAQALLLCFSLPDVECQGISCVFGNVGVEQVGRNVARVAKLCGVQVPIYMGAGEPLVGDLLDASWFHGKDGLGDVPSCPPMASQVDFIPAPGHAAVKLVEAVNSDPGNVVVVALGPLTNIALALKLDPELPKRWSRLVVMGGAEGVGNTTPTAEFNFRADPEAARLVLARCPATTLVTWDCTQCHPVAPALLQQWEALDHPRAAFLTATMAHSLQMMKKRHPEVGWWACDAVAMAVALRPELVVRSSRVWGAVEVQGSELVRGMLVVDWHKKYKKEANLEVVGELRQGDFLQLLTASIQMC